MKLPGNLRDKLKTPLGILLPNSETTKENILKQIPRGSYVISVGDATTEKMIQKEMVPALQIIDSQEKRVKRELPEGTAKTNLACNNPAGEITEESIKIIKKGFESEPPVRITVNGEEDLLVIPVCIHAPENSVVLYGQPNEGLVIVKIDPEIRNKTQSLLDLMK